MQLLAKVYGWQQIALDEGICMVSFARAGVRVNVYYSRMTVATCLNHPVQGKTQLFRKHVNMHLMEQIFEYPRVHTDKGYKRAGSINAL